MRDIFTVVKFTMKDMVKKKIVHNININHFDFYSSWF